MIRIVLAFSAAAFLVVVVAPLLGYKVDFLLNQLSQGSDTLDDPNTLVDPNSFQGYEDTSYGAPPTGGYGAPVLGARRLENTGVVGKILNRSAKGYAVNETWIKCMRVKLFQL